MEKDYKFVDFRVVKLPDWLNEHRDHNTEQIIGNGHCGDGFRLIKCEKCKEAYFTGKI